MPSNSFWKGLGTVGGGAAGLVLSGGNPMGASLGAGLGGMLAGEIAGPDASPYANYQMEPPPEYVRIYNPNDTNYMAAQRHIGGITNTGEQDVANLRMQANRVGSSPFTTMAQQDQREIARQAMSGNRADVAGQSAAAMSNLMASGGAASGARERIGMARQKAIIDANQQTKANLATQNRALAMSGEKTRQEQLAQIPTLESGVFRNKMDRGEALTRSKSSDLLAQQLDAQRMGDRQDKIWAARQQMNMLRMT